MVKLKTVASALGSVKDLNRARAMFDDPARAFSDTEVFPPDEVRTDGTEARTLALRITTAEASATAAAEGTNRPASSQGDIFAVVHIPASADFIAVLTFNPSTDIEVGTSLGELVDTDGWPVLVAIVEHLLGHRVDHAIELQAATLAEMVSALGTLSVYSRTAFTVAGQEFASGTNELDGESLLRFISADPVDDAGQTRTRNQRAVLRALFQTLRSAGLAKNPPQLASLLGTFAAGTRSDAALSTVELGTLARSLSHTGKDDIAVVTAPTRSERAEDGTVQVSFDADAMQSLQAALAGEETAEFFRYLASQGY